MTPYYERGGITIYHGDCRDVLPGIGHVDLVLTDPPYGTGGWRRDASGQGKNPTGSLFREDWDDGAVDWLNLTSTRVITFWPASRACVLLNAATDHGLTNHRCLYMRKRDPKPMPAGRTMWSMELIWVLSADGFMLRGGTDVLDVSTPRWGRDADATGHPYQKPLEVMCWLIGKTDSPVICDPFMGSGTTLRAAKDLGRRAIGIEVDERWCEAAARRLEQDVLPFDIVSTTISEPPSLFAALGETEGEL